MRRLSVYAVVVVCQLLLLTLLSSFLSAEGRRAEETDIPAQGKIVATLGLTDLSLWTEARYTRNPSQADFFSAFQNFPGALDSFPAASMVPPPMHLWRPDGTKGPF